MDETSGIEKGKYKGRAVSSPASQHPLYLGDPIRYEII
jgi:hypothetical protein